MNDEWFGLIGCGCRIQPADDGIIVYPHDGLKKRMRFVDEQLDIEVIPGEIASVALLQTGKALEISLTDSTGLVKTTRMRITGLENPDSAASSIRVERLRSLFANPVCWRSRSQSATPHAYGSSEMRQDVLTHVCRPATVQLQPRKTRHNMQRIGPARASWGKEHPGRGRAERAGELTVVRVGLR